jgi:anti-sigma factor ChrR (cupin superfamily)
MQINADLGQRAVLQTEEMAWVDSPMAGVQRRMLERDGKDGDRRATSVVRYAPNSRFSPHTHGGGEEFLVLAGTFSDDQGDYPAGTYVRNPPGSRHTPRSKDGTTIFVKLQQFAPDDGEHMVIDTRTQPWLAGPVAGVQDMPLHAHGPERVLLQHWNAGTRMERRAQSGGEEIFVLDGSLEDEHGSYPKGTWLRNPPGSMPDRWSRDGCDLYVKTGHLG